jgi:hypothetical protein
MSVAEKGGSAMRRWGFVVTVVSMVVLIAGAELLEAGPRFRRSSMEGGDGSGPSVDIIVHEVNVDPMAARVGDTIRFEMVIEDHGDPFKSTIPIEIKANGKVVASQLLRFGGGGEPRKMYREALEWSTRGASPGEYRIEGEAFVWEDVSPFNNSLKVKDPLVLLPAGAALPAGKEKGGR